MRMMWCNLVDTAGSRCVSKLQGREGIDAAVSLHVERSVVGTLCTDVVT